MQTPVLSKKQQRKALSSTKKKKDTIRNVLASPYPNYWPSLTDDDLPDFTSLLKSHLPLIRTEKPSRPWKEIKDVPKSDRKQLNAPASDVKNQLLLGINSVVRKLENDPKSVGCVLVSDEHPQYLVKHLIELAVLVKVPVLVIDGFRELSKEVIGFGCSALGIRNDATCEGLQLIMKETREMQEKNYRLPDGHIFERKIEDALDLVRDVVDEDIIVEEEKVCDLLLKRENREKRVFVPEVSSNRDKCLIFESKLGDFVPLSDEKDVKPENNYKTYKSLVVKRLKGDKNRANRKNEGKKQRTK